MKETFDLARFLAEVMVLSQHPEEFKTEEIRERMLRNMATMSRLLGKPNDATTYTEIADRKRSIRLAAMQSRNVKFN